MNNFERGGLTRKIAPRAAALVLMVTGATVEASTAVAQPQGRADRPLTPQAEVAANQNPVLARADRILAADVRSLEYLFRNKIDGVKKHQPIDGWRYYDASISNGDKFDFVYLEIPPGWDVPSYAVIEHGSSKPYYDHTSNVESDLVNRFTLTRNGRDSYTTELSQRSSGVLSSSEFDHAGPVDLHKSGTLVDVSQIYPDDPDAKSGISQIVYGEWGHVDANVTKSAVTQVTQRIDHMVAQVAQHNNIQLPAAIQQSKTQ